MRLIDADKLIEEFNPNGEPIDPITVRMRIVQAPTAYDVDKVYEQLQENSVMMGTSKCAFDYPPDEKYIEEVVKIRTAFEIVERGGIDE